MIKNSTILITGGTGSWGRYVTTQLLVHKELGQDCIPKKISYFFFVVNCTSKYATGV